MSMIMRRALLKLAGEYIIITLPILIYVCIEAVHDDNAAFLYRSPEWSIATVFLILQTIRMYSEEMHGSFGRSFSFLLMLLLTAVNLAAGVNIYISLGNGQQAMVTIAVKWLLFIVVSLLFVYIAGAAIYEAERQAGGGG